MQISLYTIQHVRKLNVSVKPSTNRTKKFNVFKNNLKNPSVGANGYADYPTYIKTRGKQYADKRRVLYKIRHDNDRHKIGSNGYYADKLLW